MQKTILITLFILALSVGVFGQVAVPPTYIGRENTETIPYINSEYNFSFIPPYNSKPDKDFNTKTDFIVTYSCPSAECSVAGILSLTSIKPIPRISVAEAVQIFQQKSALDATAKVLLESFKPENNVTILERKYAAYSGRPAQRFEFNFISNDMSFNGTFIAMYVVEKQIIVGLSFVASPSDSKEWNKICETAVRSLKILPNSLPTIKPPREGIATRIGSSDNLYPPPSLKPEIPKKISGGVLNGKALSLPKAPYPAAARAVRASGAVYVQVTIDESGKVISAKAVRGHPLLLAGAEKAAFQATFSPTLLMGQPVSVTGVIVYNFVP